MPKGPKGEKRPADVVGAAVKTMNVHPSQADDLFLRLGGVSRRIKRRLIEVCFGSVADIERVAPNVSFGPDDVHGRAGFHPARAQVRWSRAAAGRTSR